MRIGGGFLGIGPAAAFSSAALWRDCEELAEIGFLRRGFLMKTGGSSSSLLPSSIEMVGVGVRAAVFFVRLVKVGIGVLPSPGVVVDGLGDALLIAEIVDSGSESDSGRPIFRGFARLIDIWRILA